LSARWTLSFAPIYLRRVSRAAFSLRNLQPRCKALANHRGQRYLSCLDRSCSHVFQPCYLRAWLTPLPHPDIPCLCTDPFMGRSSCSPRPSRAGPRAPSSRSSASARCRRPRRAARASRLRSPGPVGPGRVLQTLDATPASCGVRGPSGPAATSADGWSRPSAGGTGGGRVPQLLGPHPVGPVRRGTEGGRVPPTRSPLLALVVQHPKSP
jgi:hypothetical protein